MSRNKIILTSKSIVWMVDGVETDRIPMKSEYSIINDYVDVYELPILFEGEKVKAFDPFEGISDRCNFGMCCGFSEQQICEDLFKGELHIPDCTRRLVHALTCMHADFYNAYCRRKEQEEINKVYEDSPDNYEHDWQYRNNQ